MTGYQEVNPSLADVESVEQTVAVGCSLVRAALGKRLTNAMTGTEASYRRDPVVNTSVELD